MKIQRQTNFVAKKNQISADYIIELKYITVANRIKR